MAARSFGSAVLLLPCGRKVRFWLQRDVENEDAKIVTRDDGWEQKSAREEEGGLQKESGEISNKMHFRKARLFFSTCRNSFGTRSIEEAMENHLVRRMLVFDVP